MITLLASPKPFTGDTRDHQMQAIRSWLALHDDADVLLYGDGADPRAVAGLPRVACVPDTPVSELGTPLFGPIVAHAACHGRHDRQVYLNADIRLTPEFLHGLRRVAFPRYLMVGSRINLRQGCALDLQAADWRERLREHARQGNAYLQYAVGSDYFAFPRGMWEGVPPIVIGRAGYDNALLAFCLRRQIPVIDATRTVLALHPEHGYGHVSGGQQTVWLGEEARRNRAAAGFRFALPTLEDATWLLHRGQLERNDGHGNRWRALESRLRYAWRLHGVSLVIRLLRRLAAGRAGDRASQASLEVILYDCLGTSLTRIAD